MINCIQRLYWQVAIAMIRSNGYIRRRSCMHVLFDTWQSTCLFFENILRCFRNGISSIQCVSDFLSFHIKALWLNNLFPALMKWTAHTKHIIDFIFFVYFSFIYMHIRPGRIERNKLLGFCRNYAQNSFRISSHCHVIKLKYFKSWSFSKIKSYCGKRIKEIQK